ncbi:hypothetical protein HLB23_37185 [Nocardia uniformis]|uniref:Uncharacterized protein n=1 Tax=Nocardia uniformis TaxID=53432 RepID=A0A849CKC1_9NOCA|nr:hypothetical protein [Nocardia uniformis]NNH75421.1 hypothetical protein [Nocardia uniformis]
MTYLLALIAVVAVVVLCWKAFGPQRSSGTGPTPAARNRVIGPDDDPEFLWRLSRQHRDGEQGSPDH